MALRAFEAAARIGSFTAAAAELCLTQSAISRHVRNLEEALRVTLFHRHGRRLTLTAAGREYLVATGDAFDRIAIATARLQPDAPRQVLALSMLPSFAVKWFAPRLARFYAAFPNIDLRISATRELVDFRGDSGIDIAIRYGQGRWTGVDAEELLREELVPVCSPEYLERCPLASPADLARATLLHGELRQDWLAWLRATGCTVVNPARGPRFDEGAALIQAAIDGQGVALARSVLVADDLREERLVRPFEESIAADYTYWLVAARGAFAQPGIRAFRDWLVEELRATLRSSMTPDHEPAGKKHVFAAENRLVA